LPKCCAVVISTLAFMVAALMALGYRGGDWQHFADAVADDRPDRRVRRVDHRAARSDLDPGQADRDLPAVRCCLLVGVWRGKALLKYLLEAAFEGLNEKAGASFRATGGCSSWRWPP
jgi:hypothetical protein